MTRRGQRTGIPSSGGYGHAGVLWSRATARDIVRVIAEDAEAGDIAAAEAIELIDRVWARAADP